MRSMRFVILLVSAFALVLTGPAAAAVSYYLNPDGNLTSPPADPSRDLGFQAALTLPFTEFAFDEFGHGYILDPSPLMAGPVNVRPNLLDVNGNNAADLNVNGNRLIETFPHVPDIAGIIEGGAGAQGTALLNRTFAGGAADVVGAGIEFSFSQPVEGFGTWVMDDTIEANGFVLKVTEVGGATYSSSLLDSGNGTNLAIEGFIGAVSDVGIIRVVLEQRTTAGAASNTDFFYLDHVQVGGVIPEPASLILLAAGWLAVTLQMRHANRRMN